MSPTSYQAAPPRNLIVTIGWGSVKPRQRKDVEKAPVKSILGNVYGQVSYFDDFAVARWIARYGRLKRGKWGVSTIPDRR